MSILLILRSFIFSFLVYVLPVLINVAFITLLERKILGFSQLRLGPNKISLIGILQPFRDAIKLFIKQSENNYNVNWKLFFLSPVTMLIISLFLWALLPLNNRSPSWPIIIIRFLVVLSLGIYPLLIIGWASNRKYASLGSIRGVAQTISYEISLALIIIQFIVIIMSYNTKDHISSRISLYIYGPILFIIWLVILLAETNRTPFDFAEGESELVSGFNVEYASTGFVLIFLREYAMILLFSCARVAFFTRIALFNFYSSVLSVLIRGVWITLRATLPRYRYDLLIITAWKTYLPAALGFVSLASLIICF